MNTKETLKSAKAGTKKQLKHVKRPENRNKGIHLPARELVVELIVRFCLAAVLSQGTLWGGHAPFSLGFIAASGSGPGGAAALCGALTGYLVLMDAGASLRYAAAAILIYAVEFAFFDLKIYRNQWFMAICSSLIAGLTGFVYLSGAGWNSTAIISFVSELITVGVSCLFFQELPGENARPDRGSILFLAAAVAVCLARAHIVLGGTVAALAAILTTRAGAGESAVTGGAMGLAVGLTGSGNPLLGTVLAFSGALTGGPTARQGRLATVLLFAGCGLLCTAWVRGGVEMAAAVALAAVVYSALPEKLLRRIDRYTCRDAMPAPAAPEKRSPAAAQVRFRLEEQATAFRTLYEHIHESVVQGEPQENSAVIFDRVAERVCMSCSHYQVCWRREHTATCQALTRALSAMLDRGNGELRDFNSQFRNRCMRLDEFLRVSNEELYRYWNRLQYRARLKNNRLAVCRQYVELAELLDSAAEKLGEELESDPSGAAAACRAAEKLNVEARCELYVDGRGRRVLEARGRDLAALNTEAGSKALSQALGVRMEPADVYRVRQGQRLVFHQCPPLGATVAVAARQKAEDQVSGDNGIWFRDDNGILWVVLCDGMGSGQGASRESKLLLTLLKDFLHAGVEPTAALTTLTGALSLRGDLDGGFTTVDLLRVDLFSGLAELFKLGGAPTYLRKGGIVSRLTGSALPAGLETDRESTPDVNRFRLAAEDFVLMVTDGVTDGSGDSWLKTTIAQYHGESPRELAQSVLSSPGAGREDDRTVVAVRISNRV